MKNYTEAEVLIFTNYVAEHKQIRKEGNTLYLPYPHEDLRKVGYTVGWATAIEMLHYFNYINSI